MSWVSSRSKAAETLRAGQRSAVSLQLLTCLAIAVGLSWLYLSTRSEVHTFDALSYILDVQHKPWPELFHPHHLAYGPLGWAAYHLAHSLGYSGLADLPLQVLNALAGACGVALFWLLVARTTRRAELAWAAALPLASSYAFWYYAVEVEVYTFAALFLIVCLWLIFELLQRPTLHGWAVLGLAQAGAVLFHQTNVLLSVPILLLWWMTRSATTAARQAGAGRQSLYRLLLYGATLALAVGLPYLWVALAVSGFRSLGEISNWLLSYAQTGWWGGPIQGSNWQELGTGLAGTFAEGDGGGLALAFAGLLLFFARPIQRVRLTPVLLSWLLVYGGFFFWWEANNIEFWIASLPPLLLLLILGLQAAEPRAGAGLAAILSLGLVMLALNLEAVRLRGDPQRDLQRQIVQALQERTSSGDLLLVPDGVLELYLPLYAQHQNYLSLNQAIFDAQAVWPEACRLVQARIEAALAGGGQILISDEVLQPPELLLQRGRMRPEDVQNCVGAYTALAQPLELAAATRYWQLPENRLIGEQPGWRFDLARWGWSGTQISEQANPAGWQFVPLTDPALNSPILWLDTTHVQAIEIRLRNNTQSSDAQLFWSDDQGQFDEQRSLRWKLEQGERSVTYRLELAEQSAWRGVIQRLRLDPVGVGDGGSITIEWIRLIR